MKCKKFETNEELYRYIVHFTIIKKRLLYIRNDEAQNIKWAFQFLRAKKLIDIQNPYIAIVNACFFS